MSGSVLYPDLKPLAQRVMSLIATLTNNTVNAIEEVTTTKADKVKGVSISIPTTGWTTSASGDYTVYRDVTASGMTANDLVILTPAEASKAAAKKAGIGCESMSGKLRIRARKTPTSAISATYHIIQGGT